MFEGRMVGEVLYDHLNQAGIVQRLVNICCLTRATLVQMLAIDRTLDGYRQKWEAHLDYESLIMDKMIDLERTSPDLLMTPSGLSFFSQNRMLALMNQGYQLASREPYHERAQWFSQWNDEWFCRNGVTKFRLIDILQQYEDSWIADFAKNNPPIADTLDELYATMTDLQWDRISAASKSNDASRAYLAAHPERLPYVTFVAQAMEYNEDLRLLRSQSVFDFIKGCRAHGKEPYEEFLDVLKERTERIRNTYGGNHDARC
jgi:hypothetical protein